MRLAGLLLAMFIGSASAWHVQNWRYEGRLAELASAQAQAIANAERCRRTRARNGCSGGFKHEIYSGPLPHHDQLNGYDEDATLVAKL